MRRTKRSGQQTAEFAVLIGLAATVAIVMQTLVRRSIQRGVQGVSDTVLQPPMSRPGCLAADGSTDGTKLCVCEDANRDNACDPSTVTSTQGTTETGPLGQRRSVLTESVTGQSESTQVQRTPLPGEITVPFIPDEPRGPRRQ